MDREKIYPTIEIYYPDRGGYFGFSIVVWETNKAHYYDVLLCYQWGSLSTSQLYLKRTNYLLEARFFVFGSLLKQVLKPSNSFVSMRWLSKRISSKWKPIMNTLLDRQRILMQEKGRSGVHIDEIVDGEIRDSL